jgi:cytochrome P450
MPFSSECPASEVALAQQAGRYLLDDAIKRAPHEILTRLRDASPVVPTSAGPWLVVGHELGQAMLRDPRFSRSLAARQTLESFLPPGPAADLWLSKVVSSDGESHRRLRGLLSRSFTPRAVDLWRPMMANMARELIDAVIAHGSMDVVAEFAYPLPEHVICALLGVPDDDHELFEAWTRKINNRVVAGPGSDDARRTAETAILEFAEHVGAVIRDRRQHLGNELLSQLIITEEEGSRLNDLELVALTIELINGGHDTTATLITNGALTLAENPALFAELKATPQLVATFVEELLRMRSPVQLSLARVATEDVELAGHRIRAGEVVLVSLASGSRDSAVFVDADEFDLARDPNQHLAFGSGAHFCLGANLARAEAQVAFAELTERLPSLELVQPAGALPWRQGSLTTAPSSLPVRWPARSDQRTTPTD